MIEVTGAKSFAASKMITVTDASGVNHDVVSLYGSVELDRMTSYSFSILDKKLYKSNKDAIQAIVADFKKELQEKIDEMGGLQF